MGSDGRYQVRSKAGRINLSQYPRHDHIPNLFHDAHREPPLKPSVSVGIEPLSSHKQGDRKWRAGRGKAKAVPRQLWPWLRREKRSLSEDARLSPDQSSVTAQVNLISVLPWITRSILCFSVPGLILQCTQHPANCFLCRYRNHLWSSGEGLSLACTQKKLRKIIVK